MRKNMIVLLILALFLLSSTAFAGNFEFVGGLNVSKIQFSEVYTNNTEKTESEVTSSNGAMGFYGGARYSITDKLSLGAGYGTTIIKYGNGRVDRNLNDDTETERRAFTDDKISGPYAELVFKLNDTLSLRGAFDINILSSSYDHYNVPGDPEVEYNKEFMRGLGFGYEIGADLVYPFTDNFSLKSNISYITGNASVTTLYDEDEDRYVDIADYYEDDIDHIISYSGFRLGLGFDLKF